jgi:hypothetical protein
MLRDTELWLEKAQDCLICLRFTFDFWSLRFRVFNLIFKDLDQSNTQLKGNDYYVGLSDNRQFKANKINYSLTKDHKEVKQTNKSRLLQEAARQRKEAMENDSSLQFGSQDYLAIA